jgi:trans-2,3-dihydro-3-hydroxyanthranilate isomerase
MIQKSSLAFFAPLREMPFFGWQAAASDKKRFPAKAQRKAAKKSTDFIAALDRKGRPPDDSRIIHEVRRAIMTRQYQFTQLDVFTETPFTGNPLAVFPDGQGLTDEQMQQIAREMNLSETVFVLPPTDPAALRKLRIFTPSQELPMAGHPVVGTWNFLAREGVVPVPEGGTGWTQVMQEIGIGTLPVDIEFREGRPVSVVMTQGIFAHGAPVEDPHERADIERGLGLAPEDFDQSLPIQAVSTGIYALAVPLKSLDALGRCRVNSQLLSDAYLRAGAVGCLPFARESFDGPPALVHSRFFAPADTISEDPATGSAAGSLAAYLVHHGGVPTEPVDGTYSFTIEQGDFMKRPSRINVSVTGQPGQVERVRVGGPAVVVAAGQVFV